MTRRNTKEKEIKRKMKVGTTTKQNALAFEGC